MKETITNLAKILINVYSRYSIESVTLEQRVLEKKESNIRDRHKSKPLRLPRFSAHRVTLAS